MYAATSIRSTQKRVILVTGSDRCAVRSLHLGRDDIELKSFWLKPKPGPPGQDSLLSMVPRKKTYTPLDETSLFFIFDRIRFPIGRG